MGWEAHTAFVEIGPLARLCILESPQMAGDEPPRLIGTHEIAIQLGDEKWVNGIVRRSDGRQAELEYWDGRVFRMSVRQPDEQGSGISTRLNFQDWIIREEIAT